LAGREVIPSQLRCARLDGENKVEGEIRGRSPEQRQAVRHARSRPVTNAFEPWLREKLALVSQKSKLAEAIRYVLSRWAGLSLFLDDGRVELDSNVVERSPPPRTHSQERPLRRLRRRCRT
jgi:transposase